MRRRIAIVGMLLVASMLPAAPASAAADGPARSFAECVVRGGEVRRDGDDLTCRHVVSSTTRTYLSGTTTCGEEVHYEIWDEIRSGTVTFAFEPQRTVDLPQVGETWPEASATPIPCLDPDR